MQRRACPLTAHGIRVVKVCCHPWLPQCPSHAFRYDDTCIEHRLFSVIANFPPAAIKIKSQSSLQIGRLHALHILSPATKRYLKASASKHPVNIALLTANSCTARCPRIKENTFSHVLPCKALSMPPSLKLPPLSLGAGGTAARSNQAPLPPQAGQLRPQPLAGAGIPQLPGCCRRLFRPTSRAAVRAT